MFRPEVVKPFQTQFPPPLIAPEADNVAAAMVAQPRVMEEGNRRFQLCFRVFDPEVERILVVGAFQAMFGRSGGGIFGRLGRSKVSSTISPGVSPLKGLAGKLSEKTWEWQ